MARVNEPPNEPGTSLENDWMNTVKLAASELVKLSRKHPATFRKVWINLPVKHRLAIEEQQGNCEDS